MKNFELLRGRERRDERLIQSEVKKILKLLQQSKSFLRGFGEKA